MEGSLVPRDCNETEFNLREWRLKARISHENSGSRRFSASYIRSFREDRRSFRSNFTISSAASSPGYHLKDQIDPSTYSFTTALKALQARSGYVWECLSPDGFALNSKWSEAERYICNPLSGEVPLECLSSKTLSGRSFRNLIASRITMSAPLVYSKRMDAMPSPVTKERDQNAKFVTQEKQKEGKTRDVGIQSNSPPNHSSYSPSPTSTPSIRERSLKLCLGEDCEASTSSANFNNFNEVIRSSSKLESKEPKAENVKIGVESKQVEQVNGTKEEEDTKSKTVQQKRGKTESLCKYRRSCGCLPSISIPWCCCFIPIIGMKKNQRDRKE
ncbi:hypothetical protein Dimus_023130 [Dionaea muscipula]